MLKHQLTSPIAQLHGSPTPQKLASRANQSYSGGAGPGQMLEEQTNLEVKYIEETFFKK